MAPTRSLGGLWSVHWIDLWVGRSGWPWTVAMRGSNRASWLFQVPQLRNEVFRRGSEGKDEHVSYQVPGHAGLVPDCGWRGWS